MIGRLHIPFEATRKTDVKNNIGKKDYDVEFERLLWSFHYSFEDKKAK